MGGATNSSGQANVIQSVNNFLGNLNAQGYKGKDGPGNAAADAFGAGSSALYSGLATGAGEAGRLPGPIGYIGLGINVVVGVATSPGSSSPGCTILGVAAGALAGIGAAAAAKPTGAFGQLLAGYFVGTAAQKAATAACQTSLGYVNGEPPPNTTATSQQAAQAQALNSTVAASAVPQVSASATPPQSDTATLAAQIMQFRPSSDYTGADGALTVQNGQTLSGIAQANGISLAQLTAVNPQIVDPNSIRTGQIIQLPSNASGYVPGIGSNQTSSDNIPDSAAQTSSLTNVLQQSSGQNISIVAQNSGQIAVVSTALGTATLIANDGTISTESIANYTQQAQAIYNNYVANGYVDQNTQVCYADYQDNIYGALNSNGQGTIVTSAGLLYQDASGNITAQNNSGSLYTYDASNGEDLFANALTSSPSLAATLTTNIQTTNASGAIVDNT
ncbi:LysM peptidoglycan-binding domain-containing protein [Collimonas fungivorans]|uniref:Egg case silk protein 2 n=1 Tax=Collimonas fungivorans (strain Ter331) TaxID=1005048 RepID=G0AH93_COLFT|nr:LysM domain-containing protein [Collimonas fungivorans]AEK62499.1 Egg case silk protein 2 [Collimonas fungivorans Ter331]